MLRVAVLFTLLLPGVARSQDQRFELGQRLRSFELAWEKQQDKEIRKKAAKIIEKVTPQFFGLNLGEAGRSLDEAGWILAGQEPGENMKWLTSLYVMPEKMLYSVKDRRMTVKIKPFYKMKSELPKGIKYQIGFPGEERVTVVLDKIPIEVSVPLPKAGLHRQEKNADCYLQIIGTTSDGNQVARDIMISVMSDTDLRVAFSMLPETVTKNPIIRSTILDYEERAKSAAEGDIPETNLPYAAMFSNAFDLYMSVKLDSPSKTSAIHQNSQSFVSFPVGAKSSVPCRILIPPRSRSYTPEQRPVVLALHGAGGSENLFFEGYGCGHIVKECERRGWYLVAPRSGFAFNSGPPVKAILDGMEKLFPIDRDEVFVVGHSMGAAQAIALAQEHPSWYRGVAALGGSGIVKDAKAFAKLPLFIGCGKNDFALSGAKSLNKALAGPNTTFKEYPDIEHLLIVREALPDVFEEWDGILRKRKDRIVN